MSAASTQSTTATATAGGDTPYKRSARLSTGPVAGIRRKERIKYTVMTATPQQKFQDA